MIPRRRLTIHGRDLGQWLYSACAARADRDRRDVRAFEEAFGRSLGGAFARATSGGREALLAALQALGVAPGDEIIVPAYTLGELVTLLKAKGYAPVAADIDPDTWNMDPAAVEKRITPRTRAIVALHLHGAPCAIESICRTAAGRGIFVIEDCAHAAGASVGGRPVGTFGDAGFFSLEANKPVATYGGGILVLKDPRAGARAEEALAGRTRARWPALKKALAQWREELLIRSPLYGPLARLAFSPRFAAAVERSYRRKQQKHRPGAVAYSGFQARLGLASLAGLAERNARLNEAWASLAGQLPEGLIPQVRDRAGDPAFYNFVARSRRVPPAQLRRRLFGWGVDIGIGNEVMNDTAAMLEQSDCPVAAELFSQAVILPLYDGLSPRRMRRIVRALQAVCDAPKS